jgi:dethiobiotin synthetase
MGKGIFVTAVDTEVGKTLCACGLAEGFLKHGLDIGVYKPVLSGARDNNGERVREDAVMLKAAAKSDDDIELINPYCFLPPVTPAHAACIENVKIEKKVLLKNYKTIMNRHDLTIIEGAGGLMVPVTDDYLVLDLIKDMDCPAIVITDTALGRINHTLMTLNVLKHYRIKVIGIIVNRYPKKPKDKDVSLLKYLKIFSEHDILGIIPEVENDKKLYEEFVSGFRHYVDISSIKKAAYE